MWRVHGSWGANPPLLWNRVLLAFLGTLVPLEKLAQG